MEGALLPIAVFVVVYVIITFELLNKAVAAMLGVMILLALHVTDEHHAVSLIDVETIMLLLGMMCIVVILRKSGIFTLLSVKIAELTQGSPLKILILFSVVTATMSAFLDNVTTVLIIIPIIVELTAGMGLNPRLFVISQAVISNIGGTATLIGDPPNIIIGSKVGLTFNQFAVNLFIPVIISLVLALVMLWAANREVFKPVNTSLSKLFSIQLLLEKIRLDFLNTPIDRALLIKSIACLVLAITLFITQTITKLSPGVVAMLVAMILFTLSLCVSPAAADSHDGSANSLKAEKAVMCKGVDQRVPLGTGNVFASDAGKHYCFTKITGAARDTVVTHKWFLNGELTSTVDLPVKSGSWRTWSYKMIGPADVGDGMVEVVSREGVVLTTIIFFIQ